MNRCSWATNERLISYHDNEWGIQSHDDEYLFELLILECFQSGLSWDIVLKKRSAIKKVFFGYELEKIAILSDSQLNEILENKEIIRNKRKVYSVRRNAIAFLNIQKKYKSFDKYIWKFVNNRQVVNHPKDNHDLVSKNELSTFISTEMKKEGFSGVGSTTCYSYLQAIGIINDHVSSCYLSVRLS